MYIRCIYITYTFILRHIKSPACDILNNREAKIGYMQYVALLRGINVGGNSKVEMPRLKSVFENLGFENVSTYINSGNVIFESSQMGSAKSTAATSKLAAEVEQAIVKEFGFKVPVIIRSQVNISKLCQKIPFEWTNDDKFKTDVMFLWEEVDSKGILNKVKINPGIEKVLYFDGALVWSVGRPHVTRGGAIKLIKNEPFVYKHMTIRNINTVRKLNELMKT